LLIKKVKTLKKHIVLYCIGIALFVPIAILYSSPMELLLFFVGTRKVSSIVSDLEVRENMKIQPELEV